MNKTPPNRVRVFVFLWLCLSLLPKVTARDLSSPAISEKQQSIYTTIQQRPLISILQDLEEMYQVNFAYQKKNLEGKFAEINLTSCTNLDRCLDQLLHPLKLTYKKVNNVYVIQELEKATASSHSRIQKKENISVSTTIQGTVRDSQNELLPGVNVVIKGTALGTTTSVDGKYSIAVPAEDSVLVFSFVGYTTEEIILDSRTPVDVTLFEDVKSLGEVVVTALGIPRQKRSLTYATQEVTLEQINEVRDPNFANILQGKVAGLMVTSSGSGVGGATRIILRGNRSIQGSNDALYVIDGIPIDNSTPGGAVTSDFGGTNGINGASTINPDDIETMTVLRGASAAALYGSRAANGVILITTKKGKDGKVAVDLNSVTTVESVFTLPKLQNAYGQGTAGTFVGNGASSWGPKMKGQTVTDWTENEARLTPQPDNVKDFFRNAVSLSNSVGVTAGSEKINTYISYSNNDAKGIIPNNNLQRHILNLRLGSQITKKLSTDAKITYTNQKIDHVVLTGEQNAPVIDIYKIPRSILLKDIKNYSVLNDKGIARPNYWTTSSIYSNPYWMTNDYNHNETRNRINGFILVKYQLIDWLTIQGRAGRDNYTDRIETIGPANTTIWATANGGAYGLNYTSVYENWYDLMVTGNNRLNENLRLNYTLGGIVNTQGYEINSNTANGLNIPNRFNLAFATAIVTDQDYSKRQTQSLFATGQLAFKDYLFLDFSGRNDWQSTLPAPYSFFYPSVGLTGIISDMVKLPDVFSFLKGRISYAQVGNGANPYMLKNIYEYSQGGAIGQGFISRSTTKAIPDLKPEITKNIEMGIEAQFWNNRVGVNATYYKTNSINQLLTLSLPVPSGYESQYINAGNIQNKGLEIVLNATPVKKSNGFTWDIALNYARNINTILSLSQKVKKSYLGGTVIRSAIAVAAEGGHYGDLEGYTWQRTTDGRFVVDASGKPVGNTSAGQVLGNYNPKFMAGLTNTLTYKNVSLRVLIDGRYGGIMVSGSDQNLAYDGNSNYTTKYREGGLVLNAVVANADGTYSENTKAINAETFWTTVSNGRYAWGEFFTYDATNFRIRELALGYNFKVCKGFLKAAKLSFIAHNLFFIYRGSSILNIPGISKRKMWFDPEMNLGNGNLQGIEYGNLPSTRSFGLNLKLSI
ncbi:SusC/RagA family TonB-linked outer membrane protein [Xanthocytophaga flava]|uniref:SusC/RagA family TonB-linked outer membrane protein n=1 Tax=Xanthocytophaga flava TaxID=3048013 RepID=UPI0028D28810|nr:SusC/RagA family TonB-linked outer membrane protein [Xanthocytophaga flavus]MDJ1466630.1 SusC/RagA family TonB-linked outer membrane protein [Xanthocytophaga flavus]